MIQVNVKKEEVWTYQYGEYKIELVSTVGNFELLVNGEVQATTKGKVKVQLSGETHLTAKLPSGEDILAIKRERVVKKEEAILFVGQQLTPQ